jgi:transketolase
MADQKTLEHFANEIRKDIVRQVHLAGSGHPGGSLSAADILSVLYFDEMDVDPEDPGRAGRDRFVLSKGHAAPVLYAALAERGFFPKEELLKLRKLGALLQGHPNIKTPGVEMSTGSLGQGFSAAVGMALASRMDGGGRVYALLGDGELEEGLVWEAAMSAAHYKLDNLCAVIDWNGLQIDGENDEVMTVRPVDEKFRAFGFHALVIDGQSIPEIKEAFAKARACKGKPTAIVAKTVKGKGVSFMENSGDWHHNRLTQALYEQALSEIAP